MTAKNSRALVILLLLILASPLALAGAPANGKGNGPGNGVGHGNGGGNGNGGHHGPPPPPPGTTAEFQRLFDDIGALLPASQNPQPFVAKARAAQSAADRHDGCTALNILDAFRHQLRAKAGKQGVDPSIAARLDTDVVVVVATLLGGPDTAGCGGGATPPAGGFGPEVTILSSDVNGFTAHVVFPRAHFVPRLGDGRPFVDIAMDGVGFGSRVGAPDVPVVSHHFAVPIGADVSVQMLGSSSYLLSGINLWPRQEQPADQSSPFGDKPFAIDPAIYRANVPYPQAPVDASRLGAMRDLEVGGVETDAAQYNPAARMLRVYTAMDVKVSFVGRSTGLFGDDSLTSVWNLPFQSVYANSLVNYDVAKLNLGAIGSFFCGEELLVITHPDLHAAAVSFADARIADGFSTRVFDVGSGEGQIGTTNTEIRDFIRGELRSGCLIRPSYVALVGDTAHVPTFLEATSYGVGFDGKIASDLEYGLADSSDLFADIAVGRIPAPDLATAQTAVDKIVGYEDHPPFSFSFYGHATFTSYFQGSDSTDDRGFTKTSETIRDALVARGYSVDRVYTDDGPSVDPKFYYDGTSIPSALRKPGFAWNGTGGQVVSHWNDGRFIVFHRDHGFPGGWANPDFTTSDIPSLTNGSFLPVVFSINCASGKFDDPTANFSEQLVQKAGGGAVGVIGDSRNSPSFTNNHIVLGMFDAIFPNVLPSYGKGTAIRRMGDVLNIGKLYMDSQNGLDFQSATETTAEHYLYHWFGDPTMQIYTSNPFHFVVANAKALLLASGAVLVQLPGSDANDGIATLVQNGLPIGRAIIRDDEAMIIPDQPIDPQFGGVSIAFDKTAFEPAAIALTIQNTPR
ncbi:MAG: hypothetical protein HY049_05225 [Acidobacteria bacterium]|nr:hypothetical protein [Acidobacteriota bacterium]